MLEYYLLLIQSTRTDTLNYGTNFVHDVEEDRRVPGIGGTYSCRENSVGQRIAQKLSLVKSLVGQLGLMMRRYFYIPRFILFLCLPSFDYLPTYVRSRIWKSIPKTKTDLSFYRVSSKIIGILLNYSD